MTNVRRIIITPGEPAGIGPDLVVMLAQKAWPIEIVVCADPVLLIERARQLNLPLQVHPYRYSSSSITTKAGELTVLSMQVLEKVIVGKLNIANSHYVMATLDRACDACLSGEFSALLTGPVHKGIINDSGLKFSGHTEYLAQRSKCKNVVMMLVHQSLRVALATTHLPLFKVPHAITCQNLNEVIIILTQSLKKRFGISHPHIYVCGLNPHAGEDGHIGREEIEVITPTLNALRKKGYNLTGPLPADTLFQSKYLKKADAILAMYHDQGLPVIKYKGFGKIVNITLGLPFIRTSVDHGTAIELAGSGQAKIGSIRTALNFTINMLKCYNE